MNKLEHKNKDGELLTINQVCELSNLGVSTVRIIADEAGAVRKIGRCYRIKKDRFFEYIETMYS